MKLSVISKTYNNFQAFKITFSWQFRFGTIPKDAFVPW